MWTIRLPIGTLSPGMVISIGFTGLGWAQRSVVLSQIAVPLKLNITQEPMDALAELAALG